MIQFRQKTFAKKFRAKEVSDWVKKQVKETNPITAGLAATGTGLGVANFTVNKKRKDADIELREEQIRATNDLTRALKKIENLDKKEAEKHSKRMKKAYHRQIPEIEHPYPIQKGTDAILNKFKKKDI